MRVLVVDEYKTMQRIIRHFLKQINIIEVDEAEDGPTALQRLRESRYDLVICDEKMDPMSGLDLLKEIRSDSHLGRTPFIMMSAENDPDKVKAARDAGVSNYIIKPFDADTLQKKIEDVV